MRFEELLDRHERGHLTQGEAGEMLGVSERTFRRWQARYGEEGAAGLRDRRLGKPSPRRAAEDELARARGLYAEMYDGFTVKHFHEKLMERHGYRLGYTVTRLALQASGQVKRAPRRGAHRRKRPRRPLPGMLLHQDAARHAWLAGRPALDLVVTLDDATSEILLGLPGGRGGHRLELAGAGRGDRRAGVVLFALHRPRQPLLPHPGRRRRRRPPASHPGRPGAGCSSASSTSPPTRRRRAAARSAPSARSRTGCPRSWRSPGSPRSTRPTPGCARSICRRTTPASPWRQRSRAAPSSPWRRRSGARCSASRRPARSATTTPCAGRAAACRSPRARSDLTSRGRASVCTSTRTARSRSSGVRTASPTSRRPRRNPMTSRRDPLRRRRVWTTLPR